jgi:hypothetical protein
MPGCNEKLGTSLSPLNSKYGHTDWLLTIHLYLILIFKKIWISDQNYRNILINYIYISLYFSLSDMKHKSSYCRHICKYKNVHYHILFYIVLHLLTFFLRNSNPYVRFFLCYRHQTESHRQRSHGSHVLNQDYKRAP